MKKKNEDSEEFKLFEIISQCPKCGNPIYACRIWDGVEDPPIKRTCKCIFFWDWWIKPVEEWQPVYPWWSSTWNNSSSESTSDTYSVTYHY